MESVHVVFDDKKIDGLTDEGHHEGLKFDNIEIYCDDSDDEDDLEDILKRIQNLPLINAHDIASVESQNAASVDRSNAVSIERQSAPSVEVQIGASVDHCSSMGNQTRSSFDRTPNFMQRSNNSGGVSSN